MKTQIDLLSLLVLQEWTQEGILGDPATFDYGCQADPALCEAEDLVRLYRAVRLRMEELGIDPLQPVPQPSPLTPEVLRITRDYRIFLPERGGEELRLRPLAKTVFIFFLKHPEGVASKAIGDHRQELRAIYGRVTGRGDPAAIRSTVDRLVDVMDNSLHENCSRLNARLGQFFPPVLVESYRVRTLQDGLRRILLEPAYVHWEA